MADKVKSSSGFGDIVKTIVYAGLIAFGIRTFAFEPFSIPSGSMIPTLLIGDYLFVSKYSYGYSKYSFPFSPNVINGRIVGSVPERGDVAVFRLPRDTEKDYIKRIIGLPGDKIQVIAGILHINGQAVKREKVDDFVDISPSGAVRARVTQYVETLPNGRKHLIIEQGDTEAFDNTEVYTVPPGHLFAMGDNRDNSQDSRFLSQVGFVPMENLIGRAEFMFFSTNGAARFWEVWRWHKSIRFDRLFKGVD
ncbi:MAG: signal peptidase I [Alphaproteobacteria bacterium]